MTCASYSLPDNFLLHPIPLQLMLRHDVFMLPIPCAISSLVLSFSLRFIALEGGKSSLLHFPFLQRITSGSAPRTDRTVGHKGQSWRWPWLRSTHRLREPVRESPAHGKDPLIRVAPQRGQGQAKDSPVRGAPPRGRRVQMPLELREGLLELLGSMGLRRGLRGRREAAVKPQDQRH